MVVAGSVVVVGPGPAVSWLAASGVPTAQPHPGAPLGRGGGVFVNTLL